MIAQKASEEGARMAVILHRCKNVWAKVPGHPCWNVQKALDEQGIDYEVDRGPWPSRKARTAMIENTGQTLYPAIEFEDGSWYREDSSNMAATIRTGRLHYKRG